MRLRNVTGSREVISESPYVVQDPKAMRGKWSEFFGNNNPIRIEIGMGKGKFLHTTSELNQKINFIGIEKYSTVLLRALEKMEMFPTDNLRFIRMDAEEIEEVFAPGEVDHIYLNFPDPWPKDRHAKRRLPSRQFLKRYDVILKPEGKIEFKTDNRELFDFALEELKEAGWKAEAVTYDLHHEMILSRGNIMTEYERKFSSMGNPICKYIISR